ncbi:hypothetical protein BVRB_037110 [Beta vulgaris subsp. vulgaris]|uniref:Uncharacterized protein n=1 Tax=Beta vulgaris subsp. vulgaris TaxID=3555 RepID=A0A0J7YP46_BETVV|nr:hypothetical protein BVRB_037110 [Beta vulgaris subsp. vulgaris]
MFCVLNVEFLRWIIIAAACLLSCLVVFKHITSRIVDESLIKRGVFIALLVVPHLCLAIYMKIEHFS